MIPHLAFPLAVTPTGAFAVVDQDSPADVAACVTAILAYPLGSRPELPDFGVAEQVFDGARPAEIRAAIREWEPRADSTIVLDDSDLVDAVETATVLLRPVDAGA